MTKFKRSVIASALMVTTLAASAAAIVPAAHSGHHTQSVASDMGPRGIAN
ncbi:MAG: hypothetical protein HOV87_34145 [Catenulispora sp.]|nr:hypothetical protein [Catenulispora sp.]